MDDVEDSPDLSPFLVDSAELFLYVQSAYTAKEQGNTTEAKKLFQKAIDEIDSQLERINTDTESPPGDLSEKSPDKLRAILIKQRSNLKQELER